MSIRVLSLFSGCGGLDLGFERAGYDIIAANEYDGTIVRTFRENFPDTKLIHSDIRDVSFDGFGAIDGIIGGPPCQSWSVAGSRLGIQDARGQLFYEYIRVLDSLKPSFFLIENVQGILSRKNSQAFESIMSMLGSSGYAISYKLVNAAEYGVPQDRKRVIIVGMRKELRHRFSFPEGSTSGAKKKKTLKDAIWDIRGEAVPSLGNKPNPDARNANEYFVGTFSPRYMSRNRIREWDEVSFTIPATARQCPLHPDSHKMEKVDADHFRFASGREDEYRRLSIREAARIQGFPDSYRFLYENVADAYKMIGNAVPVNLAFELANGIRDQLEFPNQD